MLCTRLFCWRRINNFSRGVVRRRSTEVHARIANGPALVTLLRRFNRPRGVIGSGAVGSAQRAGRVRRVGVLFERRASGRVVFPGARANLAVWVLWGWLVVSGVRVAG